MLRILAVTIFLSLLLAPIPALAQPTPGKRPVTDRPNLGVQLQPILLGEKREGVRINYVFPESAAEVMGFRTGDEVLEMNGVEIRDQNFLIKELARENIGAKVRFRIRRGGEVLELKGAMGSFQKTRKVFLEHCRRQLTGKPFAPVSEIVWPDGLDGLQALRRKVGVVVSFNGTCQECVERNWRKACDVGERLEKLGSGKDWFGLAGVYSNSNEKYETNLEGRRKLIARYPARFPLGIARYPDDRIPPDLMARDSLIQDHGVAILDPQGKLIYLELSHPEMDDPSGEFFRALQEAVRKHGPTAGGPGPRE